MPGKSHFIMNQWITGSGSEFTSADPATGRHTWSGRHADAGEVQRAVEAARDAFEGWADLAPERRIDRLEIFGAQLGAHREELAHAISLDTGKPHWESLTEIKAMQGKIGLSIRAYRERCGPVSGESGRDRTWIRYRPHGVVAIFGPFNLPGHLPNAHIVPALIAGNTVVFKPSRQAPLVADKTARLWEAAQLPPGVFNMVQCDRDTSMALAVNRDVRGLFFTGSVAGGKAIHRAVAGNPGKILALEMGGNNPLVVHEVADVHAAAYLTVQSAFITSGQRCTCARRLIVPKDAQGDSFIGSLKSLMGKIRVGAFTEHPEPFMGPVISVQTAEDLLAAQAELVSKGAVPIVPMVRLDRPGAFLSPGLIDVTEVKNRSDVEFFGPMLQTIRVPDFDAALHEADNTAFGLAAGLLSDRKDLYERFLHTVRAGIINWNRQITGASGALPFGGIKDSGNHRPSGYFAADYCSYPIASIEAEITAFPESRTPGIDV
ncbi:MAG: succinylglutamate-semialdehyde dehydrogenase [Desulfomonilaceae bacterium]|nr:succinylglutamate-semialdehyde dehydrogenase [Desulfomonilaceae bacterium]